MSPHFKHIYLPIHALGIAAIVATFFVNPMWLLLTLLGYILFAGFGISVGHHRLFSHKSFETYRPIEIALLFLGVFGGEGSSISWKAIHNGLHHPHSDTEKDIHSPVNGKLSAFGLWMNKVKQDTVSLKYAIDLMRDPMHVHVHKHYNKYFWLPIIVAGLINWHIALFLFGLPILLSIYKENLVNLFCHTDTKISYKNFQTKDNSNNNVLLGYLCWGDAFHNNHHAQPREYDFGLGRKYHWYEIDPSAFLVNLVKKRP